MELHQNLLHLQARLDKLLDSIDLNPNDGIVDPIAPGKLQDDFVYRFKDAFSDELSHPEILHELGRAMAPSLGWTNTHRFVELFFRDCPSDFQSVLCENIADKNLKQVENWPLSQYRKKTITDSTSPSSWTRYLEAVHVFPLDNPVGFENYPELYEKLNRFAEKLSLRLNEPQLKTYAEQCVAVIVDSSQSLPQGIHPNFPDMCPNDMFESIKYYHFWKGFEDVLEALPRFQEMLAGSFDSKFSCEPPSESWIYVSHFQFSDLGKFAYVDPRYPDKMVLAPVLQYPIDKITMKLAQWRYARGDIGLLKAWELNLREGLNETPSGRERLRPVEDHEIREYILYGIKGELVPQKKKSEQPTPRKTPITMPEKNFPAVGMGMNHSSLNRQIPGEYFSSMERIVFHHGEEVGFAFDMSFLMSLHEFIHTEQFTQEETPMRSSNLYDLAMYLKITSLRYDQPGIDELRLTPKNLISESLDRSIHHANSQSEYNAEHKSILMLMAARWVY